MSGAVEIYEQTASSRRKLTTNYYPILARAVAALRSDSEQTRDEIYERARDTLVNQLKMVNPPLSGADVAAEMWALEAAIARVSPASSPSKRTETAAVREAVTPDRTARKVVAISSAAATDGVAKAESVRNEASGEPSTQRGLSVRAARLARTIAILIAIILSVAVGYSTVGGFDVVSSENRGWILLALQQMIISFFVIAFPPLYLVSLLRRRTRLRAAGLGKRLVRSFAANNARPNDLQQTAQKLDDHALQWSYFLPDHTPQAKSVAGAELERRGIPHEHFANWSPAGEELAVPPAIDGTITSARFRALKIRKALWFSLFRWSAFVLATIIAASIVLGFLEAIPIPSNETFADFNRWLNEPGIPRVIFYTILIFWMTSPLMVGFLYRGRALRVLLLRPFGERRMTRALRRFVPEYLGTEGYVFTLSDPNYKPNLLFDTLLMVPIQSFNILVTYLLGPLLRNSIRICSVRNERKFRKLQEFLLRKFRPSVWSFLCGGQAFNIRSTDKWWRSCLQLLMHSCDVLVIDLSKTKAGTGWEFDQLRLRCLHSRCLFVAGDLADVKAVFDAHFADEEPPLVHLYGKTGKLADPRSFEEHIQSIIEPAIAGWNHGLPQPAPPSLLTRQRLADSIG